jgi:hypothetical protein
MEILKWLLVEGAPVQEMTNPAMEDSNLAGSTPLHWLDHAEETTEVRLAQGGASKTHMAVELIDAGARVDPLDEFLRALLLCASGAGDSSLVLLQLCHPLATGGGGGGGRLLGACSKTGAKHRKRVPPPHRNA